MLVLELSCCAFFSVIKQANHLIHLKLNFKKLCHKSHITYFCKQYLINYYHH